MRWGCSAGGGKTLRKSCSLWKSFSGSSSHRFTPVGLRPAAEDLKPLGVNLRGKSMTQCGMWAPMAVKMNGLFHRQPDLSFGFESLIQAIFALENPIHPFG